MGGTVLLRAGCRESELAGSARPVRVTPELPGLVRPRAPAAELAFEVAAELRGALAADPALVDTVFRNLTPYQR